MDIKRCLSPLLCMLLFVVGYVQRQDASSRNIVIDPAVGSAVQLPTITVEALQECISSAGTAAFILDLRTSEKYDGPLDHIKGARLIPLRELDQSLGELSDVKNWPIYVICRSGGRSPQATRMLLDEGFQAANVAGGMWAWNNLIEKQGELVGNSD